LEIACPPTVSNDRSVEDGKIITAGFQIRSKPIWDKTRLAIGRSD
jgi:hypothetical protein